MTGVKRPNWTEPQTGARPIRCVACTVTYLTVNAYLHPSHKCATGRHPSNQPKETTMRHTHNNPNTKAGA